MANNCRERIRQRHQVADLRAARRPDDEVDVGVRAGLASGDGPEDGQIAEAPLGGNIFEDWHRCFERLLGTQLSYAF